MLSKSEIKWVTSLKNKKYRDIHQAFLAEGPKLVHDLIQHKAKPLKIYTTETYEFLDKLDFKYEIISQKELKKISNLKTPNNIVAAFQISENTDITKLHLQNNWLLVFEDLQDPGNLGTILRTLDYFGFTEIVCSHHSVDVFNPKVIQASMGAVARIKVYYTDLDSFLKEQKRPIYIADMEGTSIKNMPKQKGIILFGNEGNGISPKLKATAKHSISIPKNGSGESLNVAISTGIIAAQIQL